MPRSPEADVIVIGAGPAGLMAAIAAGRRGRRVRVLESGDAPARKLAAGGGIVTNVYAIVREGLAQYIRGVEHFPRGALMGFTPTQLTGLLDEHGLGWAEGQFGQVHADGATLAAALAGDAAKSGARLVFGATVDSVEPLDGGFAVHLSGGGVEEAPSVVLATGGLAAPALGGSDLGYRTAEAVGLGVRGLFPALTSFHFSPFDVRKFLPAIAAEVFARVTCGQQWFDSSLRFTGTGVSGNAMRQISTFWHPGEELVLDLAPGWDAVAALETARSATPELPVSVALLLGLQRPVAEVALAMAGVSGPAGRLTREQVVAVSRAIHELRLSPAGTRGHDDAETTLGGVALDGIEPMSMAATAIPGLHVAGEVLDVTGWLGGYNLHWAWASGWAAGQAC